MKLLMHKGQQWHEANLAEAMALDIFRHYSALYGFMAAADVGWTGIRFPLAGREWILMDSPEYIVNIASVYPDPAHL